MSRHQPSKTEEFRTIRLSEGARILIVDDHPIVVAGLRQLVEQEPDLSVCGSAGSAAEALRAVEDHYPDLVMIDIGLPGRSGLDLLKDVRVRFPELPTLVISAHDEKVYGERVLRAGARGYLNKAQAAGEVVTAIRTVLAGELYASQQVTSSLISRLVGHKQPAASTVDGELRYSTLTDRELEVFQLLGKGFGTRQIAQRLHLAVKTIETYRARIKKKLSLETSNELIFRAVEWTSEASLEQPRGADPSKRSAASGFARPQPAELNSPIFTVPYALSPGPVYTFGRHEGAEIYLNSARVSRRHATIEWNQGWRLVDLGSSNGTELNGHPLRPKESVLLEQLDVIRIAGFEFSFGLLEG